MWLIAPGHVNYGKARAMKRLAGFFPSNAHLWILICLVIAGCQQADQSWLDKALATEQYIQSVSIVKPEGLTWKTMPDSSEISNTTLYSGTPGIVLFYLELYESTADDNYLEQAQAGADFLLSSLPDSTVGPYEVGLYTGLAGIGYTLSEVHQVSKEERFRKGVERVVNLLYISAERSEVGAHYGQISDIVYGGAGIGLFLTQVADLYDLPRADSLARDIGLQLIEQRTVEPNGIRWKMQPTDEIHMDNFSHGTAGVAYFLLELAGRTEELRFLEAAVSAGDWLASQTNEQGFVSHHLPGGEDLYYQSWCHGPAGTSRLYYSIWDVTGDQKWMDLIIKGADGTLALQLDQNNTTGFWNNVGKCCGDVGVAEHYLWLYQITGNQAYMDYTLAMTEKAFELASTTGSGIRWVHAENRRSPEQVAAQTGLMQGSAGMGLWFLQLDAFLKGKKSSVVLPDVPQLD